MITSLKVLSLKEQIRQTIRHHRRSLTFEQQQKFSYQAAMRLLSWPQFLEANTVALFLSFDGELDTSPIINYLWHIRKNVFLPVLHPFNSGNLLFLHYHSNSELILNKLKIYEPKFNIYDVFPLSKLDFLLVPLVAFNINGQRLGMGGGFYDRTLRNRQKYNFKLVGYAYDYQLVDYFPIEKWDIPLSAVVTPSKLWLW